MSQMRIEWMHFMQRFVSKIRIRLRITIYLEYKEDRNAVKSHIRLASAHA